MFSFLLQDKGQGAKQSKDLKEFSGKQPNIKVTNSQIEFFKMLDEKIENVSISQYITKKLFKLHCYEPAKYKV